jgi:DNA-binding NarL/FixJ family response regulator
LNSIVIIEDNEEVREGFSILLSKLGNYSIEGAYASCEEALAHLSTDCPDVVLMDIDLPGMSGIEGTAEIKRQRPQTEILMITVYDNSRSVFEALQAGATGYLTKNANPQELIQAIDQVLAGGSPMSANIARMVVASFQRNLNSPLSDRETEVLSLLATGKSYSHIAEEICLSRETVRSHIKSIYLKLQVNSKADAIARAKDDRLI